MARKAKATCPPRRARCTRCNAERPSGPDGSMSHPCPECRCPEFSAIEGEASQAVPPPAPTPLPRRKVVGLAWYILLISKSKVGDHRLLGKVPLMKTRNLSRALAFKAKSAAKKFISTAGSDAIPPGWNAYPERIAELEPPRKPKRTKVMTPYGRITLLERQTTFLPILAEETSK